MLEILSLRPSTLSYADGRRISAKVRSYGRECEADGKTVGEAVWRAVHRPHRNRRLPWDESLSFRMVPPAVDYLKAVERFAPMASLLEGRLAQGYDHGAGYTYIPVANRSGEAPRRN